MTSISWWGNVTLENRHQVVATNVRWKTARLRMFDQIRTALEQEGVQYWIDSGTLLGAWRGGGMIPHDDDVDIGIAGHDMHTRARAAVEKHCPHLAIKQASYSGKWEIYDPSSTEIPWGDDGDTWHMVSCDIDLYLLQEDGWQQQYFNFGIDSNRISPDTLFPLGTIQFEGRTCPAPHRTQAYLEGVYGYLGEDAEYDKETQKFRKRAATNPAPPAQPTPPRQTPAPPRTAPPARE